MPPPAEESLVGLQPSVRARVRPVAGHEKRIRLAVQKQLYLWFAIGVLTFGISSVR
jgi:hypothetical protein